MPVINSLISFWACCLERKPILYWTWSQEALTPLHTDTHALDSVPYLLAKYLPGTQHSEASVRILLRPYFFICIPITPFRWALHSKCLLYSKIDKFVQTISSTKSLPVHLLYKKLHNREVVGLKHFLQYLYYKNTDNLWKNCTMNTHTHICITYIMQWISWYIYFITCLSINQPILFLDTFQS